MLKVLLTGFGPFPGAPFNPTASLVRLLARRRGPAFPGVRLVHHVFATSYAAVDRDLPVLVAKEKPALILMFGLAGRTRHLRIETRARNARSPRLEDATGFLPVEDVIERDGPARLRLRVPVAGFLAAARDSGVLAAPSHDAGDYLCNYLCWRATRMAQAAPGRRIVAFIHVPRVRAVVLPRARRRRPASNLGDLLAAGEAILKAATGKLRRPRVNFVRRLAGRRHSATRKSA
jgi:pyroglutamyl-peptidase